jgi:hypothetical protein
MLLETKEQHMTPKELIQHFGDDHQAAHSLGKTVPCIRQWVALKKIPYWSQLAIQALTDGVLLADQPKRSAK